MSAVISPPAAVWRAPIGTLIVLLVIGALHILFYRFAVGELWSTWMDRSEYSFGVFIPLLTAFLLYQRRDRLRDLDFEGSWWGVALVALAALMRFAGDLATAALVVEYGLVVSIFGVAWSLVGTRGMRVIWVPLAFLVFMLPFPEFLLQSLSQRLQLLSSMIGVAVIRACNISVYLEGNLIDLGAMKLQVAEACSGLRYLFSLTTLGFIAAYFFKGAWWRRVVIFFSAIPITVLMNSLRIGLVGVTVEYFGKSAAEGVLHEFEGLVIFAGAMALLIFEMWLLARVGRNGVSLQSAFGLDMPPPVPKGAPVRLRPVPPPLLGALALLIFAVLVAWFAPARQIVKPDRQLFDNFPQTIEGWQGRRDLLDKVYLDVLKADDYLLADYRSGSDAINLYIQYYATQEHGEKKFHSPRLCIPGGGWEIARLDRHELPQVPFHGRPLAVNRTVITRGEATLLVYYWFQQRGRNSTNEYLTKFEIFWDSLTRHRSDGSMVRIITAPRPGEPIERADERLTAFARALLPQLPPFIPE